jgi:RNAse (barnase) inhibitor barstar
MFDSLWDIAVEVTTLPIKAVWKVSDAIVWTKIDREVEELKNDMKNLFY